MIRWLKRFLIMIFSLVMLLAVGALAIWERPSLAVNARTLNWARKYAPRFGYELKWDQVSVLATSPLFWIKGLELGFDGLCVKATDGSLAACFDRVKLRVFADVYGFSPRLTEIGPIEVLGGRVALDPRRSPSQSESARSASSSGESGFLPAWIEAGHMNPVRIELKQWSLTLTEGAKIAGSLRFSNFQEGARGNERWNWNAKIRERMTGSPSSHWARLELAAHTGIREWAIPEDAQAHGVGRFADGRRAEALLKVRPSELRPGKQDDQLAYQIEGNWFDHGRLAVLKARGKIDPNSIQGVLNASARNYQKLVPWVTLQDCVYSFARVADDRNQGDLKLNCPMAAHLNFPQIPGLPRIRAPSESQVRVKANLRTSFPPSADHPVKGGLRLEVGPLQSPLIQGSGTVVAELDGIPVKFPENWKLDTSVDLKLTVPRFENVVTELQDTQWAIPAPFSVLVGSLEFGASGKADLNHAKLPLFLRTRLFSKYQRLNIDGAGEVAMTGLIQKSKQSQLQFGVTFSDVLLALPRLSNTEVPPRWVPDSRIEAFARAGRTALKESASSFTYDVTLKTPSDHPIHLISNLANAPVPLNLDLMLQSGKEISGTVSVGDFPMEFFRRKADVERMVVRFNPQSGRKTLDGSIRVDYTDYTIRVLIFGDTETPQIRLVSEPPVAEDQLIAVLLFGKPLNELDPEQTESIGQTRAAIADQAIGMGSMFLLASTPIESVNFDPETRAFGAKVRLGTGTSLNVGQNQDAHGHIGVRKRLSRFWTITTDVARSSTSTSGGSASAFLEWSNRY